MPLERLTIVHDKYAIGRALEPSGLLWIEYKAYDLKTEDAVLLTEYFPQPLAERAGDAKAIHPKEGAEEVFHVGREAFLREVKALCGISHINIAPAIDYVEDFGTAYGVFKRPKGASLAVGLDAQGGKLPERAALAVLMPVFDALAAVHEADLLHEGISPEAIFLAQSGEPMLYRFRSAQVKLTEQAHLLPDVLLPGYAPPEQYVVQAEQGPWTDVYAGAATLYRVLAGEDLPDAKHRLQYDEVPERLVALEDVSPAVCAAMKQALMLDPRKRTATMAGFMDMLTLENAVIAPAPIIVQDDEQALVEDDPTMIEDGDVIIEEESFAEDDWVEDDRPENEVVTDHSDIEAGIEESQVEETVEDESILLPPSFEDRPAVPSSALKKKKKKRPASLFVGGGIAAAIIFAGAAFFVVGNGASTAETAQAAFYLGRADSLYANANYEGAVAQYRNVLAGDPENEYASQRLQESKNKLARVRQQRYADRMASGDSLFALGDSLTALNEEVLAREMYAAANQVFIQILNDHPQDAQALARMRASMVRLMPGTAQSSADEAEGADEEPADPEVMRRRMMTYLQEQGDALLAAGEPEEALNKYRGALNFGANPSLSEQISDIEAQLAADERQATYAASMQDGLSSFQSGDYTAAKQAFEAALAAQPGDADAQERLDQVNAALATVQENSANYEQRRNAAEQLAASGDLAGAIASFEDALNYAPSDTYATSRIAKLQEQIRAAEEAAAAIDRRTDERGIFVTTDAPPELVGTLAELHQNVEYPEDAYRRGIEGRVYVRLAVDENGQVFDANVIRGIGGGCDEEALRVLRTATFEPALVDGNPVKAYSTLFIQFSTGD